jgi:hypothetical protein
MDYKIFEQWYTLSGYILLTIAGLVIPFFWFKEPPKRVHWQVMGVGATIIVALSLIAPFLVSISVAEAETIQSKVLTRSARIADIYTLLLFFAAFVNRTHLLPKLRHFFWFTYGLAVFVAFQSTLSDVIFSSKYEFVKTVFPFLNQFGIQDFNFLSPVNYLIKFIFLSLLFRDLLTPSRWKRVFQIALWVLVIFELVQVIVFKSYLGYDSLSSTVKNVFIIGATSVFLYRFYKTTSLRITLQRNPYFWIMLGLLLPALAEIFLELIFQKLYETDTVGFYKYYLWRNASQMIGLILMFVGVWYSKNLKYLPASY